MNTFYYYESEIYKTVEEVENATKNHICKRYDIIETSKSYDEFVEEFEELKAQGNSDLDSIEFAR